MTSRGHRNDPRPSTPKKVRIEGKKPIKVRRDSKTGAFTLSFDDRDFVAELEGLSETIAALASRVQDLELKNKAAESPKSVWIHEHPAVRPFEGRVDTARHGSSKDPEEVHKADTSAAANVACIVVPASALPLLKTEEPPSERLFDSQLSAWVETLGDQAPKEQESEPEQAVETKPEEPVVSPTTVAMPQESLPPEPEAITILEAHGTNNDTQEVTSKPCSPVSVEDLPEEPVLFTRTRKPRRGKR